MTYNVTESSCQVVMIRTAFAVNVTRFSLT